MSACVPFDIPTVLLACQLIEERSTHESIHQTHQTAIVRARHAEALSSKQREVERLRRELAATKTELAMERANRAAELTISEGRGGDLDAEVVRLRHALSESKARARVETVCSCAVLRELEEEWQAGVRHALDTAEVNMASQQRESRQHTDAMAALAEAKEEGEAELRRQLDGSQRDMRRLETRFSSQLQRLEERRQEEARELHARVDKLTARLSNLNAGTSRSRMQAYTEIGPAIHR